MSGLVSDVDPDGLLEYSVVYTDRALNHMSQPFQGVMRDISETLKRVHHASAVVVVPGSGTSGMEAVARQFATGQDCLVIRNGWFSFRTISLAKRVAGVQAPAFVERRSYGERPADAMKCRRGSGSGLR